MKEFIKENWFKLAIIVILLFVGFIIYQALVVVPQNKEREATLKINAQKQLQLDKLNQCFSEAKIKYAESIEYWNKFSESTCVDGKAGGGSQMNRCLDSVLLEYTKAKKVEDDSRSECLKIYPQN